MSALEPVGAGAAAEVLEPALPAVAAPVVLGEVLLLGLVAELELVDGLAPVELGDELGELVVWATATAPSAKAPATPAMVAIFIRSYSMLR